MAISVRGMDGDYFTQASVDGLAGRFLTCYYKLVFTGNYSTGGDTLDFTNGGVNSSVPNAQARGIVSVAAVANGAGTTVSVAGGNYAPLSPAALPTNTVTTWKLKIFAHGGTEYSAGAYGSDVTGDIVTLRVVYAR